VGFSAHVDVSRHAHELVMGGRDAPFEFWRFAKTAYSEMSLAIGGGVDVARVILQVSGFYPLGYGNSQDGILGEGLTTGGGHDTQVVLLATCRPTRDRERVM